MVFGVVDVAVRSPGDITAVRRQLRLPVRRVERRAVELVVERALASGHPPRLDSHHTATAPRNGAPGMQAGAVAVRCAASLVPCEGLKIATSRRATAIAPSSTLNHGERNNRRRSCPAPAESDIPFSILCPRRRRARHRPGFGKKRCPPGATRRHHRPLFAVAAYAIVSDENLRPRSGSGGRERPRRVRRGQEDPVSNKTFGAEMTGRQPPHGRCCGRTAVALPGSMRARAGPSLQGETWKGVGQAPFKRPASRPAPNRSGWWRVAACWRSRRCCPRGRAPG